jgi:hypothetical protein
MASAPSSNQKMSPTIKWALIVGAVAVVYTLVSGPDTAAPTTTTKKTKKASKDSGMYTPEDTMAKFASISAAPHDVFTPLVKKPVMLAVAKDVPGSIFGKLTGGEANWYYTGMVELDGTKQALLENTVSGESVYVSPGETWKAARIASVDVSTLVMIGPDGARVDVPITEYGVAPGAVASAIAPAPGTQPLAVGGAPIRGQIGAPSNIGVRPVAGTATMTMPDGSTMQVPFDQTALNNGTDPTGANRRRGGRRNRNNALQGDN